MTESQYIYHRRKKHGLCTHCGANPPEPDHVECRKCLLKKKERSHIRYEAKKADILAKERSRRIERKAEAIKTGMCSRCFIRPADKGYKTCWRCRANNNDGKSYKRSDAQKARAKENAKVRRERLVAAHICIRCGKRPAREKFKDCEICATKVNRRRRELRHQREQAIPAYMRGDGTYCKVCCKPKCNGEKVCPDCMKRLREQVQKLHEHNKAHGYEGSRTFRALNNAHYKARKIKYEVKTT